MVSTPPKKLDFPAIVESDIERCAHDTSYLSNNVVQNLAWSDITVTVPDRETKLPKEILSAVSGYVGAGKSRLNVFGCHEAYISHTVEPNLRILTLSRRNDGHNGSLGLRQNDPSRYSCTAKALCEGTSLVYRSTQRPNRIRVNLSETIIVC